MGRHGRGRAVTRQGEAQGRGRSKRSSTVQRLGRDMTDNFSPERDRNRMYDMLNGRCGIYREYLIRKGIVPPDESDPDEVRWAAEGPVPSSRLETLRRPVPSGAR